MATGALLMKDQDFRFFVDRGLGSKILPSRLRECGWQVTTMDERYGASISQDLPDPEWIREASNRGEILLCKDLAIVRNALEAEAISLCSARVFALASASITMDAGANWYLANEQRIIDVILHREGPFVFAIHAEKLVNKKIKYPTQLSAPTVSPQGSAD